MIEALNVRLPSAVPQTDGGGAAVRAGHGERRGEHEVAGGMAVAVVGAFTRSGVFNDVVGMLRRAGGGTDGGDDEHDGREGTLRARCGGVPPGGCARRHARPLISGRGSPT